MESLFKSTFNARWLPTGDHRYIRTSCPLFITEDEIQFLRDNNILTVVDLREEKEYTKRPCPLEHVEGFKYLHMPVTGGDVFPVTYEETIEAYKTMVDQNMINIVDTIMSSKTGVIYFCAAGKDRTGVVSAIILRRLGFDDEHIINDYMISKISLMKYLDELKKKEPNKPIKSIIPNPDYIITGLQKYECIALPVNNTYE